MWAEAKLLYYEYQEFDQTVTAPNYIILNFMKVIYVVNISKKFTGNNNGWFEKKFSLRLTVCWK